MILGFFTLLVAILISSVSAYYSILGLTAIFAAAFWPIIIMGSALELGKLSSVVWLHYNWERSSWKIKSYLVFAVLVLMGITSMGIFGALSKYHSEQAVPSGDIQAQVQLFDEKIKTQRDNIDASRKALTQMDGAVDQILGRSTTEDGATKSANLRRSQQKERGRLQVDIDNAQKKITQLQEERAPIASKFRQVVADVGPIRYIAALIYGDNTNENMLESAVRWVIIIIVLVFDPLAIVLLLAATTSIDWSKLDKKKKKHDAFVEAIEDAKEEAEFKAVEAAINATPLSESENLALLGRLGDLESTATAQAEQVASMKEIADSKIVELDKATATIDKLTQYTDELIGKNQQLLAETQQLIDDRNHSDEEAASTRQMLESVTAQVDGLTMVIADLESEVESSLLREGAVQKDLEVLVKEYDELLAQRTDIEQSLTTAVDDIEQLRKVSFQLADLQAELDAKTDEVEQLKVRLAELQQPTVVEPVVVEPVVVEPVVVEPVVVEPVAEEIVESIVIDEGLPGVSEIDFVEVVLDKVEPTVPGVPTFQAPAPTVEPTKVEPTVPGAPSFGLPAQSVLLTNPVVVEPAPLLALPGMVAMADSFPIGGNVSFGVMFPTEPLKGDLFLRVDYMPSKLFKWVGNRWIEVDKTASETYAYNEEYVKLLVEKIGSGEYDVDSDLSDTERDQVAQYLRKQNT